jgi:hypothetical protein
MVPNRNFNLPQKGHSLAVCLIYPKFLGGSAKEMTRTSPATSSRLGRVAWERNPPKRLAPQKYPTFGGSTPLVDFGVDLGEQL